MSEQTKPKREYHHGMTPAAWTGSIMAMIGFIAAAIGAMTGPFWWLIIVGAALILIGLVAGWALRIAGYGAV